MDCSFCDKNKGLFSFTFGYYGQTRVMHACSACAGIPQDEGDFPPHGRVDLQDMIYKIHDMIKADEESVLNLPTPENGRRFDS